MAKKKTKKQKKKNKFEYSNEIGGVIVILLGIIGILGTGIVGNIVRSFAIFLVGTIYMMLLILLVVLGIILILKKDMPNMFSSRFIGIYTIVISLLIVLHIKYIEVNSAEGIKIITETFNNLMLSFNFAITLLKSFIIEFSDELLSSIILFSLSYIDDVRIFNLNEYDVPNPSILLFTLFSLGILKLNDLSLFSSNNFGASIKYTPYRLVAKILSALSYIE